MFSPVDFKSQDRELLRGLFDLDAVAGDQKWSIVKRNQHLLLVIPKGKESQAIALYEPHRRKARWAKQLLKLALGIGIPLTGRRRSLTIKSDGPLPWLQQQSGANLLGIMLGNPTQTQRRVVCLDDQGVVSKIGFGSCAQEAIASELVILNANQGLPGIPKIIREHACEAFALFQIPFYPRHFKGSPLGLVSGWVRNEKVCLGDLVRPNPSFEMPAALLSRSVARALEHGDLCPWNLRCRDAANPVAIDWEFGKEGVSGVDLVHYHFQLGKRLKLLSLEENLNQTAAAVAKYPEIEDWGWNPNDLVRYYLHTSWDFTTPEKMHALSYLK